MEGAFHIVWLSDLAPEMQQAQITFLSKHLIAARSTPSRRG
jgi:hypothetical protein